MGTVTKIEFHDRGPPDSGKELEFISLLDRSGKRTYLLYAGCITQIDLETDLSDAELQRFIVDNFEFVGSISINDELKIVQEEAHHGNRNLTGVVAAE